MAANGRVVYNIQAKSSDFKKGMKGVDDAVKSSTKKLKTLEATITEVTKKYGKMNQGSSKSQKESLKVEQQALKTEQQRLKLEQERIKLSRQGTQEKLGRAKAIHSSEKGLIDLRRQDLKLQVDQHKASVAINKSNEQRAKHLMNFMQGKGGLAGSKSSSLGSDVSNINRNSNINMMSNVAQGFSRAGNMLVSSVKGFADSAYEASKNQTEGIQAAQNSFEQMGINEDRMKKWIDSNSERLNLSKTDLGQNVGDLGAIMQGQNIGDGGANMMTQIMERATDIASRKNMETDAVVKNIISGIFQNQSKAVTKYGASLTVGEMEAYGKSAEGEKALGHKMTGSYKDLKQREKSILRYNKFLAQTVSMQGDLNKTQGSAANMQRSAEVSMENSAAIMGEQLTPMYAQIYSMVAGIAKSISSSGANFLYLVEGAIALGVALKTVSAVMKTMVLLAEMKATFDTISAGALTGGLVGVGIAAALVTGGVFAWANSQMGNVEKSESATKGITTKLNGAPSPTKSTSTPIVTNLSLNNRQLGKAVSSSSKNTSKQPRNLQ